MKGSVMAVAALLGGASAHNQQRHGHEAFHMRRQNESDQACTPVVKTITGDFIWTPTPDAQPANPDSTSTSTSTTVDTLYTSHATTVTAAVTSSAAAIPTPAAQTCPTSGTYTFPASTMTVTATTSAVVPSSTVCTAGTYTLGGTTTVVETSTVVTCPYATVSTNSAGVVTSVIKETVYTCPVAGTYTIVPGTTTTVTAPSETVTVPVISTYLPGTYTAPAVTTEVITSTVVYCPFASVEASTTAAPVVASSATPAGPAVAATTSSAGPVLVASSAVPSSAVVVVASSASSVVASASTSAASPSSTASTPALGGSGSSLWSLTYTPYNPVTGDCQTADAVEADLAAVAAAGFSSVRVYSTDCDTLPNVGAAAAKWGLKIIAGIYIGEAGCTNASPDVADQIAAFQAWDHMDLVELFAVANEAYNDGYCTAAELAALVTHVKSELGALYSGPWTTTDVVATWQDAEFAAALCPLVDVVAANAHAYFTSTVAPSDAGPFVQSQLDIIEAACSGLTGYILESGYPTAGDTIGLAVPSVANQALAITSILETVGDRVVLFSMFDDKWKAAGAYNCEQSWGIVPSLFGTVGAAWEALVAAL